MTSARLVCALLAGALLTAGSAVAAEAPDLVVNGGVEDGPHGWSTLWTREPGVGSATVDVHEPHAGRASWTVEHRGARDWSLAQDARWAVQPGELLIISAWVRLSGTGDASLGLVTRAPDGTVLDWDHAGQHFTASSTTAADAAAGAAAAAAANTWRHLTARIAVPLGTATVQLRLIGNGPAIVGLDEVSVLRAGTIDGLRPAGLPPVVTISTPLLTVALDTRGAALAVTDRRSGQVWPPAEVPGMVVLAAAATAPDRLDLRLLDAATLAECSATLALDATRPELLVTIHGDGPLAAPLHWPPAFASRPGQTLIMPVNEGISYPVDDATLPAMRYHLYGGHGLCMPWYGAVASAGAGAAWMAIVETADDAALHLPRASGLLQAVPEWEAQRGAFGYDRRLRYVFLDRGGYVAMAKRYRDFAKDTGLFRTLADKRRAVPAVDLLVGAVNVWCWDDDAPGICADMQQAGIARILWSNARPAQQLERLNAMGVLTSRYDLYQDTMDPALFPTLRWVHPDWTTAAWARGDLLREADGRLAHGWAVEAKDGTLVPCGVLCDRQALPYARERITAELKTKPYRCRFIDTTTASPWRECWDPAHPMTRSDCKRYRMELLRVVSGEAGLVCGSETGHDAAVPVVDYFEGMLSLGPYRVPDAGRDMARRWDEVPEAVATFQTGHRYRLPLWELVYHDCVVAHWYWGDYSDKLPALWDRRDLWNALYGTVPLFMFERTYWEQRRARFVQSYARTAPIARATGYSEMLDHAWLTADHAVQRSTFAGGVVVTVNFGDRPWTDPGDPASPPLAPLASRVSGLP